MARDGKPHLRLGPPQGMNTNPEVSVVMSVYNGASHLAATLDSILSQEGVELEFIVVNDGSSDKSGQILNDYAQRDSRLRIIHQENTGLTRALIRGCDAARGEFIARQDAGDISLPGPIEKPSSGIKGAGRLCICFLLDRYRRAERRIFIYVARDRRGIKSHQYFIAASRMGCH